MSILKKIQEHWLIALIISGGILLRFIPLNQYQFSHDELSAISRTCYINFSDELNYGIKIDAHPALIQLFLWFWVKLVGYSEIAIKLPFLVCGLLSIWYIYRLGKTVFNEQVGLVASTILSFSFIFLVYSSYARMYIPGVLFSIMFLQSLFKIQLASRVIHKDYVSFVVFALLCAYNHHMSCLLAFSGALLTLFYLPKDRLKTYVTYCVIIVLLYLPHLPITIYQLSVGGIGDSNGGWLSAPRNNEVYHFVITLLGCGISGKLIFGTFVLLMVVSIFKLVPITKPQTFLFFVFVSNYLVIHLYSVFRNPVLQFSVLLFSAIALILFLSSFVGFLNKQQVSVYCLLLIALFGFQSFYKKHLLSKVHVHDYEEQVKATINMQQRVGVKNVKAIFGAEPFFVYAYEKKYQTKLNYLSVRDSLSEDIALLQKKVQLLKESYVVVAGLGAASIQAIKAFYPYLVSHTENYFSNITILSKKKYDNEDVSIISTRSLLNSDLKLQINKHKSIVFANDSINFNINPKDGEFPFSVMLPLKSSQVSKNQCLVAELTYNTDSLRHVNKERLCVSVSDATKQTVFFKSIDLGSFYSIGKKSHTGYLELFAGSDYEKWQQKNMVATFFIWKEKSSRYTIQNFKVKQIDYNPTKWNLWN